MPSRVAVDRRVNPTRFLRQHPLPTNGVPAEAAGLQYTLIIAYYVTKTVMHIGIHEAVRTGALGSIAAVRIFWPA